MRKIILTILLIGAPLFPVLAVNDTIDCENAVTRQAINFCAQEKVDQSDVELEELFLSLTKNVSIAEKRQFELEQQEWQQQRANRCSDEARSELGLEPNDNLPSLFPEIYVNCMYRMSLDRQKVLSDRLRLMSAVPMSSAGEEAPPVGDDPADQLTRCGVYYLAAASFAEDEGPDAAAYYKTKGFEVLTVAQQYSDITSIRVNIENYMKELFSNPDSVMPDWQPACEVLVVKHSRTVSGNKRGLN